MTRASRLAMNALALAVGFSITASVLYATGAVRDLPPCPTEDSTGCYWDASQSGNGLGVDVVNP